ncbi:MAG TPA: hypothetical protein VF008_27365 [Niastella sp.]
MKCIYCVLFSLFVLFISCNKNDDNNDNPPLATREWFKLKTLLYTSQYSSNGSYYYRDSTEIVIDSANNKIFFREIEGTSSGMDTSLETFTYNSKNQLVLYEKVDTYDYLYISRMEFVRDASGQVTKVLSGYGHGLKPSSEGLVNYDKRGDTTFITYIDSARKHPQGYSDAQDFYQVGLVSDKVVYYKSYSMSTPGKLDSTLYKYEYDAAGNVTTESSQYRTNPPVVYTYQRGSETPKELQKFLSQWAGDLLWFRRSKLFSFSGHLATVNTVAGNVLVSKKQGSTITASYTNAFDANGNLGSVTWQSTSGGSVPTNYINTEKYLYRP